LDIVQETFISAARHIHSLHEDAKLGSWIFGIAHQKCIQQWRREKRNAAIMETLEPAPEEFDVDPASELIQREQETRFVELLDHLPPHQRSVLLLHYLEDFSLEEIASVTLVSVGTVKSRLHYARKALRNLWEHHDENTARDSIDTSLPGRAQAG